MLKKKEFVASILGSVLEWYDFALYGFFAPLFGQIFFPNNLPLIALLKSFGIFSVGFMARPIGGLIFGFIADKYGRTACLKITPILITIPTFIIAFLPSYQEIGIIAPIALLLLRIIQGLCIAGEFSNNIIYLCESFPSKKRYFLGSIGACTGSLGIFFASLVTAVFYSLFSYNFLINFGWRIAFGVSAFMGIMIYILRKKLPETNFYNNLVSHNKTINNPINESIKSQKLIYLKIIGLTYLSATSFYFIFIFMPNFSAQILGIKTSQALGNNSLSLIMRLLFIPLIGLWADKIGGVILTRISCIFFIFFSFPFFYLFVCKPEYLYYGFYGLVLISVINAGSIAGLQMEILNSNTRCTVFSFSFNFCFGIFGGIVPLISFYLFQKFNNPIFPVYYLIFSAIITFITTFYLKIRIQYDKKLL